MSTSDDDSHEDDDRISLIPGTRFTVLSGFRSAEINILSRKILRIALFLCMFQVLLTVFVFSIVVARSGSPLAALRLLDLVFSACLFYLAYTGVTLKNEQFCPPFTHLGGYYFIMVVVLIFELIRLYSALVLIVATGDLLYLISIAISLLFVSLEVAAIHYVRTLLRLLDEIPGPGGDTAAAPATTSQADDNL